MIRKARWIFERIHQSLARSAPRPYALGLNEIRPLVHSAPEIAELTLDERDNVREGFLEHEQYVRLGDELPAYQRLALVIGYHLGIRRGEILKLRLDQVDWAANLIRREKKQTKKLKVNGQFVDAYYFCLGGGVGAFQTIARPVGYRCVATEVPVAIERLLRVYLEQRNPDDNLRSFFSRRSEAELRSYLAGSGIAG